VNQIDAGEFRADAELATQIAGADAGAFERMMRQHNRRLFRVARSILRDDADAEDAVQDGYIRAYQAIAEFRGQASLATWLTRIIVNQALENRRRKGRQSEDRLDPDALADIAEEAETPESLAMRSQLTRLIETSVDRLPEAYRTVFILRAVEGLSVAETAAALDISEANTKVRFLRARVSLREALGRQIGPILENAFDFLGARCDRIVARVLARLGLPPSQSIASLPDEGAPTRLIP